MTTPRLAVVGAGAFGRNHLRVLAASESAALTAVVDIDRTRAETAAGEFGCAAVESWRELAGKVEAAVIATPTVTHAEIGCGLLEAGIDVLVEKPIADDMDGARRLIAAAVSGNRILQVGHLERFNPAVAALQEIVTLPLFFEIHRLNVFSPRSLDVDVILDLMIHDLDIVLSLTGSLPEEIRAAGVSILSEKVDIANVRLAFATGCIANLTASRVSTERVRKLRLFQAHEYISLDYGRQDAVRFTVSGDRKIGYAPLTSTKDEPLKLEVESFLDSVVTRRPPRVTGEQAARALAVALEILVRIEEHGAIVRQSLER